MTLDQCDSLFGVIRSAASEDQVTAALRALFVEYPLLEFAIGRGNTFWRGRRCNSGGHDNVSRLSYPPPAITKAGRLNDAGSPCLYAATKKETVLAELDAAKDDYIHLIGFRILPNETIRGFTLGDLFHVHKTGYLRTFGTDPGKTVSRTINSYGLEKGKTFLYIDAFFGTLLADREAKKSDYLMTRRLAMVAYQKSQSQGMFYPSVADYVGMNFAMLPHAFDTQTNVVCSKVIRIVRRHLFGFYDYEVTLEATGVDANGSFAWRKPESQERMLCFGLTKEEAMSGGESI
jgi:RES domain-containing protein